MRMLGRSQHLFSLPRVGFTGNLGGCSRTAVSNRTANCGTARRGWPPVPRRAGSDFRSGSARNRQQCSRGRLTGRWEQTMAGMR
jgi:hypothetical protein